MNGNDPNKTRQMLFEESGGVEAVAWIADDIFAVILKGGYFYVVRLEDIVESPNLKEKKQATRGVRIIFKQKLELKGETRQLIMTERKIPSYAGQRYKEADEKPE